MGTHPIFESDFDCLTEMSKKKGLSLEEKMQRALDYIRDSKTFWHMKELEKNLPKFKGITPMAVKDVIQALIDDDKIMMEKVGSSSYYWSFESQVQNSLLKQKSRIENSLNETLAELEPLEQKLKLYEEDTEEIDEQKVTELEETIKILQAENLKMTESLKSYSKYSPEALEKMQNQEKECLAAANRWTDNVWNLEKWILKRLPHVSSLELRKHLQLPEDLDYINP